MIYILMHKSNPVIPVDINDSYSSMKVGNCINSELVPIGCMCNSDVVNWIKDRAIPVGRDSVSRILQYMNVGTREQLMFDNLSISLTDCYWLKPANMEITWEMVNPYNNNFNDVIGEIQLNMGDTPMDIKTYTPGCTLQGVLKKKWVAQGNDRYLLKGNMGTFKQQAINEVIATRVHDLLQYGIPYVRYNTVLNKNGEHISVCKSFSSEATEQVSLYSIYKCMNNKSNNMSVYEKIIEYLCNNCGMNEVYVRNFLEYQIKTDYIITNTDRHLNNIVLLRDSNTLKLIGFAPMFDFGTSLFYDCDYNDIPKNRKSMISNIKANSFNDKEVNLLKNIKVNSPINIEVVLSDNKLKEMILQGIKDENRARAIYSSVLLKCRIIEELQRGVKPWKR